MLDKAYWVWLSLALGAGARVQEVLQAYPDARAVYEAEETDRRLSGVFTPGQIKRLAETKAERAVAVLNDCKRNGWGCITYGESEYPTLLRRLPDAPLVLYVWGSLDCVEGQLCFGIVGTREPAPESVCIARKISAELSQAGAVIVSGGALGIDSAAHEGALLANGKTIAVLGCGLGERYLMANAALRNDISKNGAVISEFPPFTGASKSSFPIRNRIISGISRGILVVEAGEKSGSIITASCAAEQGRDVFAVPGNIVTSAYAGANKLIRDGAHAVSGAQDILAEYAVLYPGKLNAEAVKMNLQANRPKEKPAAFPAVKRELPQSFSQSARKIYSFFGDAPLYPGELAAMASMGVSEVIACLTDLEIEDYIISVSGGRYQLK